MTYPETNQSNPLERAIAMMSMVCEKAEVRKVCYFKDKDNNDYVESYPISSNVSNVAAYGVYLVDGVGYLEWVNDYQTYGIALLRANEINNKTFDY